MKKKQREDIYISIYDSLLSVADIDLSIMSDSDLARFSEKISKASETLTEDIVLSLKKI